MNTPVTKRALDLALAVPTLVLTAPLHAVIATLIACKMGRPIYFAQLRPGLGEKPFRLLKFRTMAGIDPIRGRVDDASRLTALGRWLRATSLDELPTLWNVVVGDMSIVGPRPLLLEYLSLYDTAQRRRHQVRPGITGLAQVSGRNELSWRRRLSLDVAYVDHHTTGLDFQIIVKTFLTVVTREGIAAPSEATMPKFSGNEPPS